MDPQHKMPKSMEVLAVVLAQKQDFKGAAENMRAYLKAAPNAPDAEHAKQQLEEIEHLLTPKEATANQPQ
jgi:regulator of sirC expression with transglutaminase-like and TPR domain